MRQVYGDITVMKTGSIVLIFWANLILGYMVTWPTHKMNVRETPKGLFLERSSNGSYSFQRGQPRHQIILWPIWPRIRPMGVGIPWMLGLFSWRQVG